MPRWIKIIVKTIAVIAGIILIAFIAITFYVNANKKSILISITRELNKNLNGKLTIGNMEPTFLQGFPGVSISLNKVMIRDSLWEIHHHTLLEARNFNVSVNPFSLLKGIIEIKRIEINRATIYLYTDSNGYSNTSVFAKGRPEKETKNNSGSSTEIRHFILSDVNFIVDNQRGHKLFHFVLNQLKGDMDYLPAGWKAEIKLDAFAKRLAFNTKRGSFIKDQPLKGPFSVIYDRKTEIITIAPNTLNIGENPFLIHAKFNLDKSPAVFSIHIEAPNILWNNASALLTPNIKSRLDMFNLKFPINVKCDLLGNMGAGGDPCINVVANVKNNELTTPGGSIDNCNFMGVYTNSFIHGRGFNDSNSAIKLYHFSGRYTEIPFTIDTAFINNFDRPIATGILKAQFPIVKLNALLGDDLLHFTKGSAAINLFYKADIINFMLTKPLVTGKVDVQNASLNYVPRKLNFTNTSISLNFTGPNLFIKNIQLQSGKSIVYMEGSIRNFLNSYYASPEKVLLSWKIRSPQLYIGEFLGFLRARAPAKKRTKRSSFSENLNAIFEKSRVDMHLQVDKIYYHNFLATDAIADLLMSEHGIHIRNMKVMHGGGTLTLNGNLYQKGLLNRFDINAALRNVNIRSFFYGFNNFGLKSFTSANLRGNLGAKVQIGGSISDQGKLLPNSLQGSIVFDLKRGALLNFDPIVNVGKFAFPLRNLNNIAFSNLKGKFDVNGGQVIIHPMQISSSVLNMDVAGVYALNKGTNITIDVPLRNPKKDQEIMDAAKKQEKRMKGIVLHLLATDGEDGKIKIKLNKNPDKDKQHR